MAASFTCPRCGRTSWHPTDVAEGYCGACHAWTRPGPARVASGLAPGGVVLHVYDGASGVRLLERRMAPGDDVAAAGERDGSAALGAIAAGAGPLVVVVYDGDTGERHPSWVGLASGSDLRELDL